MWWDVGVGKTLATLDALQRIGATKVLVVGPRQVVETTWPDEIEKWGLDWDYGVCTRTPARRMNAIHKPMVLLNYDNLVWFFENIHPNVRFDVVVFDELSKMKAPGTKRWRKFQNSRGRFDRVWGLTGSPAANHLLNTWGQMRTLTPHRILERTYTMFKRRWFYPVDRDQYIWVPLEDTPERIETAVAPYVHRAERDLAVELRINDIRMDMPKSGQVHSYNLAEFGVSGNISIANPAVLGNKLIQVASGAVYDDDEDVVLVHDEKLDRIETVVDELQGQPLIIFYNYQHELARLRKRFPQARPLDVDAWNKGEIELMLLHPGSAGHGLNLQKGGHHVLFMSLPWSLELYEQAIGRVYRQGQEHSVTVHRVMCGFDWNVARALDHKDVTQAALLKAIDDYREEL